jgi:hypothetical protein
MRSGQRKVLRPTGTIWVMRLFELADFQQAHHQSVEIALWDELSVRDARWSEAVAVGNLNFVEKMKSEKRARRNRELIS